MPTRDPAIARTPEPPYYAAIFTSRRTGEDEAGYADMAARLVELATRQPGFIDAESTRGPNGLGITVSYWESEEAIAAWHDVAIHRIAQQLGKERWYADYELRIALVTRAYGKPSED
ncbi:antibiotic biosynthesis monooxygenase [Nitrogeniibacter mangrovi]|uniref:Antibiotic biosynthesis monooxygenase n=1 Tax=Nitrogeniibacter mangrovi TaxID=2016596 RepID=A0A6C1B6C2_9RHOO|nr:antibiotic biosynthesis monooxygenase [Nitrogeniibacter mangrovi]QID17794.1 antibiotic biosynthesis monooxygenase [Nitrogeniibacter mangrovi]